ISPIGERDRSSERIEAFMADEQKKKGKPSAEEIAARKAAKSKQAGAEETVADDTPQAPAPTPRLVEKYRNQIVPALQQKFGYKNLMAVPRLEKIVISMGLGRFAVAGGEGKANIDKAE